VIAGGDQTPLGDDADARDVRPGHAIQIMRCRS
jgi:hypothetical protein